MSHLLTTRLVLDPLSLDDASDLFEARGDPEVLSFWDWPADPSQDITRAMIAQMLAEVDLGRALYWTIRLLGLSSACAISASWAHRNLPILGSCSLAVGGALAWLVKPS